MSVILDALKRVQEENRRRDVAPERLRVRRDHEGSALLRRLRAGAWGGGGVTQEAGREQPLESFAGRPADAGNRAGSVGAAPAPVAPTRAAHTLASSAHAGGGRVRLSPSTWAALGLLAVTSAVALVLWWMQPELAQRRAPDRPLLQELSAGDVPLATRPNTATPTPSGEMQEFERFGGGADVGAEASPEGSADGFAAQGQAGPRGAAGDDSLSDLTAALPPDSDAGAADRPAEPGSGGGVLQLEVQERPADAPDAGVSGAAGSLRITSSRPGAGSPPPPGTAAASGGDAGTAVGGATTSGGPPTRSAPLVNPYLPRRPEQQAAGASAALEEREAGEQRGRSRLPQGLIDPGVKAAFREGVRLHKAGDWDGAEQAYKRALKFDPHNARVNANLGVLYEQLGRLGLAERHLRQAVGIEPDNANAHNNLGVVLYRQGNYEAALTEFNRTLELDPRRVDAYTNKGLIFTRWGDYEKAQRAFLQVLAIEPDNALAHYNLGLVYEQLDLLDKALDHYYRFLSLGASEYPDIASYLSDHLEWLQAGRDGGGGRFRGR